MSSPSPHDLIINQPDSINAELHIDSSQHPTQPHVTYLRYSKNNPLGLLNTGLSDAGGSPARTRSSTPQPTQRRIGAYTTVGGWETNVFGEVRRVETGKIEEVDDLYGDIIHTLSPEPYNHRDLQLSDMGAMGFTSPLPRDTTPPPRPMPKAFNLRSTTTSALGVGQSLALSSLNFSSPPINGMQESDLISTSLRSTDIAVACVDNLSLLFTTVNNLFDVRPNVAACEQIKKSLLAVKTALGRRSRFTEEQWQKGSQGSHLKYNERLSSLGRTLQKLCSFENYVTTHTITLKLVNRTQDKLREYEAKLSNLELKFNALFDRIRVRGLHDKLNSAHMEAQRLRSIAERLPRDTFKTRWEAGKALRANLRRDYHAYRSGRRTSLMT